MASSCSILDPFDLLTQLGLDHSGWPPQARVFYGKRPKHPVILRPIADDVSLIFHNTTKSKKRKIMLTNKIMDKLDK